MSLRSELHKKGVRFRKNVRELPGSPDIVLPKYSVVVFVHGCFWHRHEHCSRSTVPKTNTDFWIRKFRANTERDARKNTQLKEMGWHVYVAWECQIIECVDGVARNIMDFLSHNADHIR